jgi:hypothetical protein
VSVEQRPHALRELRLCLLDIPPCRHTTHDRTTGPDGAGQAGGRPGRRGEPRNRVVCCRAELD